MLDLGSKALFHTLAGSSLLKRLARHYGLRQPASPARRFVAGETLDEAVHAVRRLEAAGLLHTLDHLGESVTTFEAAEAAARQYALVIDTLAGAGVGRNISVKLTQLGLDIDRATCLDNLRRVLDPAARHGCFVRIDMEGSHYTAETLDIFEMLWQAGYRHMGVVLQAALYRSEPDLARLNALGARVRLVKGAYNEPRRVAYRRKADVDAAFLRLMDGLFREGTEPAIATHDPVILDEARRRAAGLGVPRDRFEFQLLYGVRRDLQTALVAEGYRVRIYVPFGREWFPYFMRRLGERPANLLFILQSLVQEERAQTAR
jgi:proline dehydrogenase